MSATRMSSTALDSAHARVAARASFQHGLFTSRDARLAGLSRDALQHGLSTARYTEAAPRVYAIAGAPRTADQLLLAAILGGRPHAVVARLSAVALHGFSFRARVGRHAVLVPYRCSVRFGREVRVHRTRTLVPSADLVEVAGMPATSVPRSLVDLGSEGRMGWWRDLVADAMRTGATTREAVAAQLDRSGALRHKRDMRRVLGLLPQQTERTRSRRELRLLEEMLRAGLPRPVVNFELVDATGRLVAEIDLAYPQWRIGFEFDSDRYHLAPSETERDKSRDLLTASRHQWIIHRIPERLVDDSLAWLLGEMRRLVRVRVQEIDALTTIGSPVE